MKNVRQLYLKGLIDKKTYQNETRDLFEMAEIWGNKEKRKSNHQYVIY